MELNSSMTRRSKLNDSKVNGSMTQTSLDQWPKDQWPNDSKLNDSKLNGSITISFKCSSSKIISCKNHIQTKTRPAPLCLPTLYGKFSSQLTLGCCIIRRVVTLLSECDQCYKEILNSHDILNFQNENLSVFSCY